jgi:hypothetical protein
MFSSRLGKDDLGELSLVCRLTTFRGISYVTSNIRVAHICGICNYTLVEIDYPFGATGRKGCSLRAAVFGHADLQKFRVSGWSSLRRSQSRHTNTLPHYLKRSGGCPISCRAKSCARAIDGESLRLAPFPTLPVLQSSTGWFHIRPKRHDVPDPVGWVGTEMFAAANRS